MPAYTFDMLLAASITVEADNPHDARAWLVTKLNCADTNFGAFDNGNPILGEVSLADEDAPTLVMIDGADVAPKNLPPIEALKWVDATLNWADESKAEMLDQIPFIRELVKETLAAHGAKQ